MLLDFLAMIIFVFILSAIVLTLAVRTSSSDSGDEAHNPVEPVESERHLEEEGFEELARMIEKDQGLLTQPPPVQVPHIPLPDALLGGGANEEAFSKATGTIVLKVNEDPNEKREYNRRLRDRRTSDIPTDDERRIVQRRVWLRREEDRRGKTLLTVADAADTIGVPVERIYKWLDESDIPFYQVTEGKKKAIRFEIDELLQWYGAFTARGGDSGEGGRKGV